MIKVESWQRLEPHSRNFDISKAIQASVQDPLWLLARSWMLGEFEGEDTGSPVYAKISAKQDKISQIIINNHPIKYDSKYPLEALVEKLDLEILARKGDKGDNSSQLELDLQMRMKLGLQFHYEMEDITVILSQDKLKELENFLAADPELVFLDLNEKQAEFETDITEDYLSAIKLRLVDIYRIFNTDGKYLMDKALEKFPNDIHLARRIGQTLIEALNNVKIWWDGSNSSQQHEQEEPFFEKPSGKQSAWTPRNLEYNLKAQIGQTSNNTNLILDVSEYTEEHLDWYSFTVDQEPNDFSLPSNTKGIMVVAPSNLNFKGMPEKRWWNFEDSYINFGSITPKTNNIATLLLMEFAFVHSPDWYIIPYQMEVGTLSQIETLLVRDCFGDETPIEPAGYTSEELNLSSSDLSWRSWNLFSLSRRYSDDRGANLNTRYFFLPPTVDFVLTSPPLEEIKLLRDETANLSWAVERKFRTLSGESVDGYDHYLSRKKKLEITLEQHSDNNDQGKPIKYSLMSNIPWNWIPFIPVHTTEDLSVPTDTMRMRIELQRASMINPITKDTIRPNSRMLNEVQPRYYVEESEIPRTGVILSENCTRTIWYDGRVFLWFGRKKSIGSGEGSSGLRFDIAKLKS